MFPLVEKYLASELSQKAFCRERNLPYAVFGYWLRKYRNAQRASSPVAKNSAQAAFVPLHVTPQGHSCQSACELVFPNGIVLRFTQPMQTDLLIQLIRSGA
jgi:hypothetical protein